MTGAVLMGASLLAAIVIPAFIGPLITFHFLHTHLLPPNGFDTDMIIYHWGYIVLLTASFIIGLVCWAWPARKPPLLAH
jgi:hypothetical protein